MKRSHLAVTLQQLAEMTDEELAKRVNETWRPFFPGKECMFGGSRFYLTERMWWDFLLGAVTHD